MAWPGSVNGHPAGTSIRESTELASAGEFLVRHRDVFLSQIQQRRGVLQAQYEAMTSWISILATTMLLLWQRAFWDRYKEGKAPSLRTQ